MLKETLGIGEQASAGYRAKVGLEEALKLERAHALIIHRRPLWNPDTHQMEMVELSREEVHNVITTVGRDFIHTQSYGTSPAANGLNYIALSDDAVTENSASTTLSNEIAANGLSRAQGTVVHTAAATTTTIEKVFTCTTAQQAAKKAALFTASSSGTMNHVLGFTERTLQVGDTLDITFTITIS